MSVDELDKVKEPSFETKAKRPSKWAVVMSLPEGMAVGCHLCVLRNAFNIDAVTGMGHIQRALRNGDAVIMQTPHEVAEMKAQAGNEEKDFRAQVCVVQAGNIHFRAEPLS